MSNKSCAKADVFFLHKEYSLADQEYTQNIENRRKHKEILEEAINYSR